MNASILFGRSLNALVSTQFYNSLHPKLKNLGDLKDTDPFYKKSPLSEKSKWLVSLTENYPEYKPDYTVTPYRGVLAYKNDPNRLLNFQFNPTEISDIFAPQYEDRTRTGVSASDFSWVSGSVRTIEFNLFLDATLGSINLSKDKNLTHSERGILNQIEFLQSLTRPYLKESSENIEPTKFVRGAYVGNTNRFYPPPEIIFVYGNYYLTGVVGSLSTKLTLFDRKLVPVRGEANVSLKLHDGIALPINKNLTITLT
jgi:hypothetical protein